MASKLKIFDFSVKHKPKEKPKQKHVPKRDVFPSDIIENPKYHNYPNNSKKLEKQHKEEQSNHKITTPSVITQKRQSSSKIRVTSSGSGTKKLVPVVALGLLFVFAIQSVTYLNTAKSASGLVLGAATSAYDDLDAANKSLENRDFTQARSQFSSAQQNLAEAQEILDRFKTLTAIAPPARSADNILTGASFLAEAGRSLTTAMQLFDQLSVTSEGIATENFTDKLQQNRNLLANSLLMLSYAQENFNHTGSLPAEYSETMKQAQSQINTLNGVLKELVDLEDLFLSFFGPTPKTYLLVFENYDEMRGTGGFIGTYGVLKYDNGKITKLKIESIYNLDGSLTKQIAAPGPFQPDIKKWGLRDSNWFADFPTSAQKMMSFFEMESETADGVLALTPQVFGDILKLVGPVEMPDYNVTLTPENFQEVVQNQTSVVYDKKLNQPKKFLNDFAPILLNKLSVLGKEQWFSLFQIFKDDLSQKHILLYSLDPSTQDKISQLGFDGGIAPTDKDYLAVINSNHGGTKTDLDVKQSIAIKSQINFEGKISNTLTITRQNTAIEKNRDFMRVLVPHGSQLTSSSGFADEPQFSSSSTDLITDPDLANWDVRRQSGNVAIREESGKTEFTGWVETPGGTTSTLVLEYSLPITLSLSLFNLKDSYSLLFQKQPGSVESAITGEWNFSTYNPVWSTSNTSRTDNFIRFNTNGKTDEYWGAILSR